MAEETVEAGQLPAVRPEVVENYGNWMLVQKSRRNFGSKSNPNNGASNNGEAKIMGLKNQKGQPMQSNKGGSRFNALSTEEETMDENREETERIMGNNEWDTNKLVRDPPSKERTMIREKTQKEPKKWAPVQQKMQQQNENPPMEQGKQIDKRERSKEPSKNVSNYAQQTNLKLMHTKVHQHVHISDQGDRSPCMQPVIPSLKQGTRPPDPPTKPKIIPHLLDMERTTQNASSSNAEGDEEMEESLSFVANTLQEEERMGVDGDTQVEATQEGVVSMHTDCQ